MAVWTTAHHASLALARIKKVWSSAIAIFIILSTLYSTSTVLYSDMLVLVPAEGCPRARFRATELLSSGIGIGPEFKLHSTAMRRCPVASISALVRVWQGKVCQGSCV